MVNDPSMFELLRLDCRLQGYISSLAGLDLPRNQDGLVDPKESKKIDCME